MSVAWGFLAWHPLVGTRVVVGLVIDRVVVVVLLCVGHLDSVCSPWAAWAMSWRAMSASGVASRCARLMLGFGVQVLIGGQMDQSELVGCNQRLGVQLHVVCALGEQRQVEQHLLVDLAARGLLQLAPKSRHLKLAGLVGAEQPPLRVRLDALHEEVGDPEPQ